MSDKIESLGGTMADKVTSNFAARACAPKWIAAPQAPILSWNRNSAATGARSRSPHNPRIRVPIKSNPTEGDKL
jgi:hypothetical protein